MNSMSALFDFPSMLVVVLLLICTSAYARSLRPGVFDNAVDPSAGPGMSGPPTHTGFVGFAWKTSRIGERMSLEVAIALVLAAFYVLFIK